MGLGFLFSTRCIDRCEGMGEKKGFRVYNFRVFAFHFVWRSNQGLEVHIELWMIKGILAVTFLSGLFLPPWFGLVSQPKDLFNTCSCNVTIRCMFLVLDNAESHELWCTPFLVCYVCMIFVVAVICYSENRNHK